MPQAPARRDVSGSSAVAELVRLHHRRRGWAWVAIGSVTGLVVYLGIDAKLFANFTGTAETLSVIPVFVLLALALAGLVIVIADTSRIHRADAAVQANAKGSVSHYPVYAHAYSYPPRHHGSWVFAILMLVAMTGITVFLLPAVVNAWGYVVGAEHLVPPVRREDAEVGVLRPGAVRATEAVGVRPALLGQVGFLTFDDRQQIVGLPSLDQALAVQVIHRAAQLQK